MTFPISLSRGSGKLAYRLVIQGFDYEWVTDSSMEQRIDVTGINRCVGLQMENVSVNYETNYFQATITANGNTFKILDINGNATKAFCRKPSRQADLTTDLVDGDTVVNLSDASGWNDGDTIFVGSEAIRIETNDATSLNIISRGNFHSQPYDHHIQNQFGEFLSVRAYDVPISLTNRKVILFAYDPEYDNLQGDGHPIWKGLLTSDFSIDGGSGPDAVSIFTLNANATTDLFDTTIGAFDEGYSIRGYYFPDQINVLVRTGGGPAFDMQHQQWRGGPEDHRSHMLAAPVFFLQIFEMANTAVANINEFLGYSNSASITISGFYETKEKLLQSINNAVATATSAWTVQNIKFIIADSGQFAMTFQAAGGKCAIWVSNVFGLVPAVSLPVDEWDRVIDLSIYPFYENIPNASSPSNTFLLSSPDTPITTTTNAQTYIQIGKNPFPNAYAVFANTVATDTSTNRSDVIYIDSPFFPATISGLSLVPDDDSKRTQSSVATDSLVQDSTSMRFQSVVMDGGLAAMTDKNYKIQPFIRLVEGGSIVDLFQALIDNSSTYADFGIMPLITGSDNGGTNTYVDGLSKNFDDIDMYDVRKQFARFQGGDFFRNRVFDFGGKGQKLSEVISEELKLIGFIPSFTSEGKFTIRKFEPSSLTAPSVESIDGEMIGSPSLSRIEGAIKNSAVLSTEYDIHDDKWTGDKFKVNYEASISAINKLITYEVKPYSNQYGFTHIDETVLKLSLIRPILLMGVPAIQIEFDAPLSFFGVGPGDSMTLSSEFLPNFDTSIRGVSGIPCFVLSTRWDLDKGQGTIKGIAFGEFNGYAPTLRVMSGTYQGSNTWVLECSQSCYAPIGSTDISFFQTNFEVEALGKSALWSFDRTSGTLASIGSIGSQGGQLVTVNFYGNNSTLSASRFQGAMLKFTNKLVATNPPVSQTTKLSYQKQSAFISSGSNAYVAWTTDTAELL